MSKTIGFMTIDKNGIERFFEGETRPRIIFGYTYAVNDNQGKLLPDGSIKKIVGWQPNWHQTKTVFEIRA